MEIKTAPNLEAGFSLIEVMISLAVFGIVLTGVVTMFVNTTRSNTGQEMMVELTQDIRTAKNLMVDEIRSAGCNTEDKIRMGFLVDSDDRFDTDDNSIHFIRDIDNGDGDELYEPDGDTNDSNEDVAYYRVDGAGNILVAGDGTLGTLVRNTGGGGQPVANNILDLEFQYFDSSDNPILLASMTKESVLDRIRTVEVNIIGQVQNPNWVSVGNQEWTQQFRIRVRNL